MKIEELESRDYPTILGVWYEGMAHIINTAPFSYTVSSEAIVYGTNSDDRIEVYGAPFVVYGLDGNDTIIGSDYADILYGGSGDDYISALLGVDTIYGEDGNDYIVGDSSGEFNWTGSLSDRVLNALEFTPTDSNDIIDGGTGFNMLGSNFTYEYGGATYLSPGVYNWGNYKYNDIHLVGLGDVTFVGTKFDAINITLENIKIDITGLDPYPQGYVNSFAGEVVLSNVEVYGLNNTNSAAVYFNAKVPTNALMLNSYVHDVYGDAISTGGTYGSSSKLELFNVVGARSGPAENNQVLTAHNYFTTIDVLGNYSDARSNVVAPDNTAPIKLNYTTVSAGNRMAGVQLNNTSQIYKSTLYDQYTLNVMYSIAYTDIYTGPITTPYFITVQSNGGIYHSYVKKTGTSQTAYRNYGEIVDTVFEGWF